MDRRKIPTDFLINNAHDGSIPRFLRFPCYQNRMLAITVQQKKLQKTIKWYEVESKQSCKQYICREPRSDFELVALVFICGA